MLQDTYGAYVLFLPFLRRNNGIEDSFKRYKAIKDGKVAFYN